MATTTDIVILFNTAIGIIMFTPILIFIILITIYTFWPLKKRKYPYDD